MRFSLPIVMLLLASMPVMAETPPKAASPSYPIAGLHPDQRPEGAPVIRDAQHPKDWDKVVVHGIAVPLPPHLATSDLGAWYSPFSRPGMVGRYDLRGWHKLGKASKEKKGRNKS